MEFVQFHPLAYIQWDSEAVRRGAYLLNSEGDRFMAQYAVEWSWLLVILLPRDRAKFVLIAVLVAPSSISISSWVRKNYEEFWEAHRLCN